MEGSTVALLLVQSVLSTGSRKKSLRTGRTDETQAAAVITVERGRGGRREGSSRERETDGGAKASARHLVMERLDIVLKSREKNNNFEGFMLLEITCFPRNNSRSYVIKRQKYHTKKQYVN